MIRKGLPNSAMIPLCSLNIARTHWHTQQLHRHTLRIQHAKDIVIRSDK